MLKKWYNLIAQHSTAQHSTAQHSTAQRITPLFFRALINTICVKAIFPVNGGSRLFAFAIGKR